MNLEDFLRYTQPDPLAYMTRDLFPRAVAEGPWPPKVKPWAAAPDFRVKEQPIRPSEQTFNYYVRTNWVPDPEPVAPEPGTWDRASGDYTATRVCGADGRVRDEVWAHLDLPDGRGGWVRSAARVPVTIEDAPPPRPSVTIPLLPGPTEPADDRP